MAALPFVALTWGRASCFRSSAFEEDEMIVCVCNELREKDCREAAGDPSVRRASCVYRRLNCRVRCGACVSTMESIVEELRAERLAGAAADPRARELILATPAAVE